MSIPLPTPAKYLYPDSLLTLAQIDTIYRETVSKNKYYVEYINKILQNLDTSKYTTETKKLLVSFSKDFNKLDHNEGFFEKMAENVVGKDDDGLCHLQSFEKINQDSELLKVIHLAFMKCHESSSIL